MWVIVEFVDDVVVAVPISWVIKSSGIYQCFWPKTDERSKRTNSEVPPAFLTDDWELYECALLLNGAIYFDFEDALAIEMGCIDINEVNTDELPKLSWKHEENETELITTENTETAMQCEASAVENVFFSEFQELLNRPDLCSTLNEITNEHSLRKEIENVLPSIQSKMLDKILKNQEEKKKMLVKLMAKMYSLESAVGYNPQLSD